MPKKINKTKEIKSNSDVYEIYLGTFNDDVFTWYSIKKFKDATQAYKEFKKYVNTQLKYTDEELKKVWDTGRLDIELRLGNKLLNWVGIYSREVKELSKAEEKEAEEGKIKKSKKSKKDSIKDSSSHGTYTFDVGVDAWIDDIEIYADSYNEAKEQLLNMDLDDIIRTGNVKDFALKNIDYDFDEDEDWNDGGDLFEDSEIKDYKKTIDGYISADEVSVYATANVNGESNKSTINFNQLFNIMDLDKDDATLVMLPLDEDIKDLQKEQVKIATNKFKSLAKYIINTYIPNNEWRFGDLEIEFGDDLIVEFNSPMLLNYAKKPLYRLALNTIKLPFDRPYARNKDLFYKSHGVSYEQSFNQYNDSVHKFFLSFDFDNSLKGSAWADEYMGWCGLDESNLVFDHVPTDDEVEEFLESTIEYLAQAFNEYNTGDDSVEGEVGCYFSNIKLFDLNKEYHDQLVKEYPDVNLSFEAII